MNAQKESLKKTSGVHKSSHKPTKTCVMKMKVELEELEKNDRRLKYFLMEGRVYKVRVENLRYRYQTTSGQRFFIIEGTICLVNEWIGAKGMVFKRGRMNGCH